MDKTFDVYVSRSLKKWSMLQSPPGEVRRLLLRRAMDVQDRSARLPLAAFGSGWFSSPLTWPQRLSHAVLIYSLESGMAHSRFAF